MSGTPSGTKSSGDLRFVSTCTFNIHSNHSKQRRNEIPEENIGNVQPLNAHGKDWTL